MTDIAAFDADLLPTGLRTRRIAGINGLTMHILEAGDATRPCLLLLHGFPDLAFCWRHVMPVLAAAGYHVVAPDQRGYGRTTGWDGDYDGDLASYRSLNLVQDMLALVAALGHRQVAAVIGHDAGSRVAACCALTRPDIFPAVVMMSAPFAGLPHFPFGTAAQPPMPAPQPVPGLAELDADLAKLVPPRKHYQRYYMTREADADMRHCPQGLRDFLRAYFHHKSADWRANAPQPLKGWQAREFAKLPRYYVMDHDRTMPESVAPEMPSPEAIAANRWLTQADMDVYATEFARTGFQGGLQWYRVNNSAAQLAELRLFGGRTIDVPAAFVSGQQDWGHYQMPGALEAMQRVCTHMRGVHFVAGAGHWVQQEQPAATSRLLLDFLADTR